MPLFHQPQNRLCCDVLDLAVAQNSRCSLSNATSLIDEKGILAEFKKEFAKFANLHKPTTNQEVTMIYRMAMNSTRHKILLGALYIPATPKSTGDGR